MRMFRKDEGFTLVELMVVVLIIGILVAVAIPIFNNASNSARVRTCQSNQRTIEGAVQQYNAAKPSASWSSTTLNQTFPVEIGSGHFLVGSGVDAYLKTAPLCPADWGGTYTVNASGTVLSDGGSDNTPLLLTGGAGTSTNTQHAHF